MAATDFINGSYPITGGDIPVKNTSGSALAAGATVKLDTGHLMGAAQGCVGVVAVSAVTDQPLGVLIEAVPNNGVGRCRIAGAAWAIAEGAITAGATVGASGATAGDVTTYTATDPYLGIALTSAASAADPVLVLIGPGKTA